MKKAIMHMVLGLRMTQLQHLAYWGIWKILIIITMKKQTLMEQILTPNLQWAK